MAHMTTKKTCKELERWMSGREQDQECEYERKSAVLEAVRNTGIHERYAAQEEVDRLLATGVLIHRDDAEGLAAAMTVPDLGEACALLRELVGMWSVLDRPNPDPKAWGAFEDLVNRAEDLTSKVENRHAFDGLVEEG